MGCDPTAIAERILNDLDAEDLLPQYNVSSLVEKTSIQQAYDVALASEHDLTKPGSKPAGDQPSELKHKQVWLWELELDADSVKAVRELWDSYKAGAPDL